MSAKQRARPYWLEWCQHRCTAPVCRLFEAALLLGKLTRASCFPLIYSLMLSTWCQFSPCLQTSTVEDEHRPPNAASVTTSASVTNSHQPQQLSAVTSFAPASLQSPFFFV